MATESNYAKKLNEIQKLLKIFFDNNNFRRKARNYNKQMDDGLIHVISFQMGQYPIGNYVIPGLRENLWGKFAIDLGIYIPQIDELETNYKPTEFKNSAYCTIRERLMEKDNKKSDQWYEISDDIEYVKLRIQNVIENIGFEFLNKFKSIDDILKYYTKNKVLPFRNAYRSMLDIALIYYKIGNKEIYNDYVNKIINESKHIGFIEHVKELKEKLKE